MASAAAEDEADAEDEFAAEAVAADEAVRESEATTAYLYRSSFEIRQSRQRANIVKKEATTSPQGWSV